MSTTNHDSSRKPSGSSTHSAAHSNLSSPNVQPLRDLSSSPRFLGVGMGSTGARKSTNSGWQMWGNKPTSRNPSASSATSLPDSSILNQGSGYRPVRDDSWNAPRSISASWDEMGSSPQRSDLSLDQASYQHARQRQTAPAQSTALDVPSSGLPNPGQYASQRFGDARDPAAGPKYATTSPARGPYDASHSSYNSQQQMLQARSPGGTYTSLQGVDDGFSAAMRGMAIEEEYAFSQQRGLPAASTHLSSHAGHPSQPPVPAMHTIVSGQQARPAYNSFPQPDYSAYYPSPSYSYDAYRTTPDPTLYASSPALSAATPAAGVYPGMGPQSDIHPGQQVSLLYDFSAMTRAHSQYYYPPHLMYHPAHTRTSVAVSQGPPESARDVQGLPYANIPPSPAQHHVFVPPLDYTQLSHIVSPAVFGHAMSNPFVTGNAHAQRGKRGGHRYHHHEESNVQRSALLEEFRSDRTKVWELKNLLGHIVEFSRDQHGSRFIQTKLESATDEEKQLVFDEIVPAHTARLIQDVFGNYVIQKLFEFGTLDQQAQLVAAMENNILALSLHVYGCRVVQKAVELVSPEQQSAFVNELESHVLKLVKDANGNHVIQKMVQVVAPERLPFVNAFRGHVLELATHPFGCRVLQRCLENMPVEHTRPLLDEMLEHSVALMQDQFGNYVVQYVLEHGQPQDNELIVAKLQGHLLAMARHKFASNVCEKALITSTPEMRRALIDEIVTPKHEGANNVMMMMRDQYANYVLQRALSVVEGDQKEQLVGKVKPQLMQLRKQTSHFSKHLLAIERLLEKCSQVQETPSENSNTAPIQPNTSN
ncbi:unnamed protein product [Somion occarium]|uniref:PUM-HD domain-containing protein n=1 Tax=Somion occarium TaxID=3059160 RepID=A0ABP1DBS5_9APHY